MAKRDEHGLTTKWRVYADALLSDPSRNQGKAYQAAYPGTSAKTARERGSKLSTNVNIKAYLDKTDAKNHEKAGITQEKILNAVGGVAFQDIRLLYDEHERLLPVHELSDEAAAFISGMDIVEMRDKDGIEESVKKYKSSDRIQALTLLMKNMGMLSEKQAEPEKAAPITINFVDAIPPAGD